MTNNDRNRPVTDEELVEHFKQNFTTVASFQGRLSYLIMSVHVINPEFLETHVTSSTRLLYFNMVYGVGIMIYSRPNMKPISPINRAIFSILGSLMFNYSSMAVFKWIRDNSVACSIPGLPTCLGFLVGRILMLHLMAFLYHVDTRGGQNIPRNSAFDSMYYQAICLGMR